MHFWIVLLHTLEADRNGDIHNNGYDSEDQQDTQDDWYDDEPDTCETPDDALSRSTNAAWQSDEGVYVETFLKARVVTIMNVDTRDTKEILIHELVAKHSVLYVVKPNVMTNTKLGKSAKTHCETRLLNYLYHYGTLNRDEPEPKQGIKLHFMLLSDNAAITNIETSLKRQLKAKGHLAMLHELNRPMGTERFDLTPTQMCNIIVQQLQQMIEACQQQQQKRNDTHCVTLRRTNGDSCTSCTTLPPLKKCRISSPSAHRVENTENRFVLIHMPHQQSSCRQWDVGEYGTVDDGEGDTMGVIFWLNSPLMQSPIKETYTDAIWRMQSFLPVWVAVSDTALDEHYRIPPPIVPGAKFVRIYTTPDEVDVFYSFQKLTSDYRLPNDAQECLKKRCVCA